MSTALNPEQPLEILPSIDQPTDIPNQPLRFIPPLSQRLTHSCSLPNPSVNLSKTTSLFSNTLIFFLTSTILSPYSKLTYHSLQSRVLGEICIILLRGVRFRWNIGACRSITSPLAAMRSRGSSCGAARTSARAQNPVTRLSRTPRAQMKYGRNL